MDDPDLVDGLQAGRDLQGHTERGVGVKPSQGLHDLLEVGAGDELHGDVPKQAVLPVLVHAADVPVVDFSGEPDLRGETPGDVRIAGELMTEHLEGDRLLEPPIVGLVDGPHSPGPQDLLDLVSRGDERPRREHDFLYHSRVTFLAFASWGSASATISAG